MNYQKMIKMAMANKGIRTQHELAHLAGISKGNLSDIANGNTEPKVKTLVKIADACGVGIATFLSYGDE